MQVVDEKASSAFETLLADIWTVTDTLVSAQKEVKTMGRNAAPASETTCIVTDSRSGEIGMLKVLPPRLPKDTRKPRELLDTGGKMALVITWQKTCLNWVLVLGGK